jgi:fatty-acyl-CoA synthase
MAALVLRDGAAFDGATFEAFLAEQPDLGPKQWPSFVRIAAALPRTATFKVLKRVLSAEGTDCADPVFGVARR